MHAFATYYPFDTLDVVPKWTETVKRSEFASRLNEARENIVWAAAKMKINHYLGIFAVPEYYFLKKFETVNHDTTIELYSEEEYDDLLGWLIGLSDQNNRILILPGSISWRKKLAVATTDNRNRPILYDGFSSTPILYRGNLVHTYDKVMNDGNIQSAVAETRFSPGTQSPLFKVMNLNCGVEICGDFNEGNLAKAAGPLSLDFEFMMSATNFHMFNENYIAKIPVRDGGYFMHVDQSPTKKKLYNGVWCVNRTSGWHGSDLNSKVPGAVFDPWTLKELQGDAYGTKGSVGSVLSINQPVPPQPASGIQLPGQTAFAGLKVIGFPRITRAVDPITGHYEVTLHVELMAGTSTAPITNRNIEFKAEGATVQPSSARTDQEGKTSAVFRIHKDSKAKLIASFHGSKYVGEASIVWVGPGFVSRIGTLKGTPYPLVPTFYTPFA